MGSGGPFALKFTYEIHILPCKYHTLDSGSIYRLLIHISMVYHNNWTSSLELLIVGFIWGVTNTFLKHFTKIVPSTNAQRHKGDSFTILGIQLNGLKV